ncbi:MAG: glycosyltransferase family 2 protein [Balneolales bacterium]|nr:glycosyltransferase family 2 protein [Balneolales bacterium]
MDYPLVSIISVNFNGLGVTREFLASLRNVTYPSFEVILVDNGSKEDISPVGTEFPEIKLIKTGENLGFAGANNVGIANASGKYLMFLNNDTEVASDFLFPLVQECEADKRIGMASPKIVFHEDGKREIIQYSGSTGINPFTMREANSGSLEKDNGQFNDIRDTMLGHGAAMMIPTKVAKEVGLMPDIFFLYYEEHDWCQMIRRAGYKVRYVGTSAVYHKESVTVGKNSVIKSYYMVRGRLLYMRRNTSGSQFLSSLLFFLVLAFPKNTIKLALNGDIKLLKAYINGVLWHLRHSNVKENPEIRTRADGTKEIVKLSGERLRSFA